MKHIVAMVLSLTLLLALSPAAMAKKGGPDLSYRQVHDEGFVYEAEGYNMVINWYEEDDAKVFGRMWTPADFDENSTYPTIVMCHGHSGNSDFWDKSFAPAMAKCGYVCYAMDCRSANDGKRDISTPNDDHKATVSTYTRDILAAVDFILEKPFVDKNNLYLMGQSMGGMAVQAAAAAIPEKVNGLIVLYGMLSEGSASTMDNFADMIAAPYANGEVLFMVGTLDGGCNWDTITYNMGLYENSTAVLISGARHGYGMSDDRPAIISEGVMDDFIQRTLK